MRLATEGGSQNTDSFTTLVPLEMFNEMLEYSVKIHNNALICTEQRNVLLTCREKRAHQCTDFKCHHV